MDYFIIGYTMTEYLLNGILIPKKVYTSEEKARGKKEAVKVSEEQLAVLRSNKVFAALENNKKLRILDKQPAWAVSGADREAALQARIKELEAKKDKGSSKDTGKVSELKAALKEAEEKTEAVTQEAQKVIDELRAEIAELKKGE